MADSEVVRRLPQQQGSVDRGRWPGFMLLGVALVACGLAALMLPAASTMATSTALGGALAIAGVVTMVQTYLVKGWSGFSWQMLAGAAEVVGGILIWVNPLKGAAAVMLLVAVVVFAQGVAQLGLSLRIRPQQGWGWLCVASLLSILISAALVARFPYQSVETPGAMAGLALALAGVAYIVLAIGSMKIGRGLPDA